MKKIFRKLVKFHWDLFSESVGYFFISLPFVVIYFIVRKYYYKSIGRDFWGRNEAEIQAEKEEFKKRSRFNSFGGLNTFDFNDSF